MKCKCGCGQEIQPKKYHRYKPPEYMHGHNRNLGKTKILKCDYFSKTFKRIPNKAHSHLKHSFCSIKCSSDNRRKEVNLRCSFCDKPITRRVHHAKRNTFNYCSQKCCKAHRKKANLVSASRNPMWNGGVYIDKGYEYTYALEHPHAHKNHVATHRLLMEQAIGRLLNECEVVHHIDQNKLNNQIDNLMLLDSAKEHARTHWDIKKN